MGGAQDPPNPPRGGLENFFRCCCGFVLLFSTPFYFSPPPPSKGGGAGGGGSLRHFRSRTPPRASRPLPLRILLLDLPGVHPGKNQLPGPYSAACRSELLQVPQRGQEKSGPRTDHLPRRT